jgi:hypothetical protein
LAAEWVDDCPLVVELLAHVGAVTPPDFRTRAQPHSRRTLRQGWLAISRSVVQSRELVHKAVCVKANAENAQLQVPLLERRSGYARLSYVVSQAGPLELGSIA